PTRVERLRRRRRDALLEGRAVDVVLALLAHEHVRGIGALLPLLVRGAVVARARPEADARSAAGHGRVPARAAARAARAGRAGSEPRALEPVRPRRPLCRGRGTRAHRRRPARVLPPAPRERGVSAVSSARGDASVPRRAW